MEMEPSTSWLLYIHLLCVKGSMPHGISNPPPASSTQNAVSSIIPQSAHDVLLIATCHEHHMYSSRREIDAMIGEAGDQVTVNAAEANASRMRDASLLQDFCTKRKKDARRELAKDNRGVCVAAEEEGGACCAAGEGNFSIARGGENRKTGIGLCGTQRRIDIIPPPHLHPSKPYNLCRQPRQQQNLIHDHSVSHLARQLSIGKCHDIFAYGMRNIVLGVSVRHTVSAQVLSSRFSIFQELEAAITAHSPHSPPPCLGPFVSWPYFPSPVIRKSSEPHPKSCAAFQHISGHRLTVARDRRSTPVKRLQLRRTVWVFAQQQPQLGTIERSDAGGFFHGYIVMILFFFCCNGLPERKEPTEESSWKKRTSKASNWKLAGSAMMPKP
ncbi:hypothetical protein FPQ18DRAFT_379462 [Pyronema domesticum]|nr:hypothetical protein FPQ18DRAFT_379462 [Pyronema domesticum]